mmetsp:Transcript_71985/g.114688  ORF Transcript_71985/g.114688 Transcript_71985/m.114688 type:complete len:459 (+) Transcript_71985:42-1418(+)
MSTHSVADVSTAFADTLNITTNANILDLNQLVCEIKLVNNWKKLQLRECIAFSLIDPTEIQAMFVAFYKIYCPLATVLQYKEHRQSFKYLPDMDEMTHFLRDSVTALEANHLRSDAVHTNPATDEDIEQSTHSPLLSIQIELPLLVIPLHKDDEDENDEYIFYGFANGTLLLYKNEVELKRIESLHRKKICYNDILSMFDLSASENYWLLNPKNPNLELNLYEQINGFALNEVTLQMMKSPEIRCVICLDHVSYLTDEFCRISCCQHLYHYDCIQSLIRYGNDNQCPLCRERIKYVQYLYQNNVVNKVFKVTHNELLPISHRHYLNKFYVSHNKTGREHAYKAVPAEGDAAGEEEYDEKEGQMLSCMDMVPSKPCLGFLESMPSPTHSNSSISIPPTRHSDEEQEGDEYPNSHGYHNNNNNNNNDHGHSNNSNNNNNNNNTLKPDSFDFYKPPKNEDD